MKAGIAGSEKSKEMKELKKKVTELEIAEIVKACSPVPEMAMIIRRLAYERDSLKEEIKYHESQAVRTW